MQSSRGPFAVVVLFLLLFSFRAKAEGPKVVSPYAYVVPICVVAIVAATIIPIAVYSGAPPRSTVIPLALASMAARFYGRNQNRRYREDLEQVQSIMVELAKHLTKLPMATTLENFAEVSAREQALRAAQFFAANRDVELANFQPWRHRYFQLLKQLGGHLDVVAHATIYPELAILYGSIAHDLGNEDAYGIKENGRMAALNWRLIAFRGRRAYHDLRN